MTMAEGRVRPSDFYAIHDGVEYRSGPEYKGKVTLMAHGEGAPPAGFTPSPQPDVSGIKIVPRAQLERYDWVRTTCYWHGEGPFVVNAVMGSTLYLLYWGTNGTRMAEQPLFERNEMGTYDAILDVSEVEDLQEEVTEK